MKITIIGTGYVGLVTGACLAEIGHDVFCLDVDPRKIEILNNGGVPIHEPGLQEIIARTRAARRIQFSTDIEASVAHGEVQFIAVGTPPDEDGSADLQYVLEAARNIGRTMSGFKVIVDKSTVPVGTAQRVRAVVEEELAKRGLADSAQHRFSVVSNPEFLKEGAAVDDFMRPDRIVLGSDEDEAGLRARELMKRLYAPFNRNHERTLYMDVRSAEFTKYAANAMLATRISFMNEMSNLADKVGADIEAVRRGIGSDPRIGYHFLYAGCGYGGSCFPKDVQALIRTASEIGENLRILEAVEDVNYKQKDVLVRKITDKLGQDLSGRTFAVWGLAFKPNTDDMREAPSRRVIAELLARGANVRAYDPVAVTEARRVFALDLHDAPEQLARLTFTGTQDETLTAADALVVVTEWKEFKSPDFLHLKSVLKSPLIFDGRNLYEPDAMTELGIDYHSIGRPYAQPTELSAHVSDEIDGGPSVTSPELTVVPREQLAAARVLVVGDVMLDRYWFGDVNRISPEAPVPVVHVQRQEDRLGGAANVARNAVALGAQAGLLCVVGRDEPGERIVQLLDESGVAPHLERDPDLLTTIKLRVLSRQQQLLRVDFENTPAHEVLLAGLARFDELLPSHDVILMSDYAKGGLTHVTQMIAKAHAAGKPVLVDPKGDDWERYRGATLITPNRAELREVVGQWKSEEDLIARVTQLRAELEFDALLLTRSEEGMTLFSDDGILYASAVAREVYDVSGAGDTVIATLAAMLGAGLTLVEAVGLANRAAGIVVGKLGTATVDYDELFL